jgi:hypothetical protein
VGRIQSRECILIRLADLLELLHVTFRISKVDMCDLQGRSVARLSSRTGSACTTQTDLSSAISDSSCCSRLRSLSTLRAAPSTPSGRRSYTASLASLPWSCLASSSTRSSKCFLLTSAATRVSRVFENSSVYEIDVISVASFGPQGVMRYSHRLVYPGLKFLHFDLLLQGKVSNRVSLLRQL